MMNLYELRKSGEINQGHDIYARVVARACGMSQNKYFRAERGLYIPNALETRNLARFFNISLESMTAIIDETVNRRVKQEEEQQHPITEEAIATP